MDRNFRAQPEKPLDEEERRLRRIDEDDMRKNEKIDLFYRVAIGLLGTLESLGKTNKELQDIQIKDFITMEEQKYLELLPKIPEIDSLDTDVLAAERDKKNREIKERSNSFNRYKEKLQALIMSGVELGYINGDEFVSTTVSEAITNLRYVIADIEKEHKPEIEMSRLRNMVENAIDRR